MNKPSFDFQKKVQVLNYLANKAGEGRIEKIKAIKLAYFADRFHVRKYGRLITNDYYFAMKKGPVASTLKDIAENSSDYMDADEVAYALDFISQDNSDLVSCNPIDEDLLSQSDKEALNFSILHFGDIPTFDLIELTHKYPEWNKFEERFKAGQTNREEMNINDFFNNPKNLENDVFSKNQEDLENAQEIFNKRKKEDNILDN